MDIKCAHDDIVDLVKLVPNPKNPNKHPSTQIDMLSKIISYQGQRLPIVVSSRSGFIVKGHGRLEAITRLGWPKAAVDYQEYEDEAQEFADMIADNKIAELAQHDNELFKIEAIKLDFDKKGFDLDLFGIPNLDLSLPDEAREAIQDEVPDVTESISKLGDLYQLGEHRLLCGDSTDKATVERLMNGEKADMVFTDPPYNIAEKTKGIASQAPTNKQNAKLMASQWDKGFDFSKVQESMLSLLSPDCTVYVCTSSFVAPAIWKWMEEKFDFSGYCVWSKPNPFPSLMKRRWAFSSELVCYATNGKQVFNYPESGNALSVWNIPIGEGGLHPTQKPVAVSEHAIKHSSNSGNNIADLFGGSGSTLIACEKTNRKCFMMELDPHYIDVIVSRWCKYTGKTSIKRNGEEMQWPMK